MSLINRNMRLPLIRTREGFEYWLFDMDDAINCFLSSVPEEVRIQLDYSINSLDSLESWLLRTYSGSHFIFNRYEHTRLDDIGRYVGETFRKSVGGQWNIRLDNSSAAFFELPILRGSVEYVFEVCPITLTASSIDRRTGKFLRTILENILKEGKRGDVL